MYRSTHFVIYFLVLWSESDACIAMKSSKDDGVNIWPTDPTTGLSVAPTSASTLNEMTTASMSTDMTSTTVITESTTTTDSTTSTTTTTTTTMAPWPEIAVSCATTLSPSTIPILPNACDDGWTAFSRIKGVVCLKAFIANTNFAQSQAGCTAQNAVLSGIENNNERNWIHEQFISLVAGTMNIKNIYIGAARKTECYVLSNYPPACLPLQTQAFIWSDTTVTGTDGFCPWWKDQPDNYVYGGTDVQKVIQMAIMGFPGPYGAYNAVPGGLDDVGGSSVNQGYVCSKPANP